MQDCSIEIIKIGILNHPYGTFRSFLIVENTDCAVVSSTLPTFFVTFCSHITTCVLLCQVADDGYGVCYLVLSGNVFTFHISCKNSCPDTVSMIIKITVNQITLNLREHGAAQTLELYSKQDESSS